MVVASGAKPMEVSFPGIDKPHVVSAWDVLTEKVYDLGKHVVVVGGSGTGCETAHFIAAMGAPDPDIFTFLMYHRAENPQYAMELLHAAGRKITVIDMVPRLADNVGRTFRWSLMKSLRQMGVVLRPKTRLLEIRDDKVIVETVEGKESIRADSVVTAIGVQSVNDLVEAGYSAGIEVLVMGDAREPRGIPEAVREGFEGALKI